MKYHPQPLNWRSLALKNQRGFTLTELLVSMGLSMFVLAGVGSLFRAQSHTVKGQESKMEANEYALTVLDMVVREVRNAGYFPSIACDATGGITSATATAVTIQYDKNSSGVCSGDDEIVVFAYDSANKNVTRNGVALSDGNVTAVDVHLLSAADIEQRAGALLHFRRAIRLQRHAVVQLQDRAKDHHLSDRRAEKYRQQLYRFAGDHVVNRGFAEPRILIAKGRAKAILREA